MSTPAQISVRSGLGSGRRPVPVEAVIRRRLLSEMWKLARWFWPVAVGLATGIGITIATFTPITQSIWENAGQWPRWWLFALAIALVATHLPVVVLHGVTRRAAIRALLVSSVLISMSWALFMVAGHVVERFLYDRFGRPDTFATPHLFSSGYDVLPMFAEFALIFLAYQLSGALIGGLYYRFGGIRGTLLLPLGLLPVVAMEVLLSTGWYGSGLEAVWGVSRPVPVVLALGVAAIVGFSVGAIHVVLRDVPIHGQE